MPADFYTLLADETRRRILRLLVEHGELCVCELVTALDLPQPFVSRHLAALRKGGVVRARRAGQWVFYGLNPSLASWQQEILRLMASAASAVPEHRADSRRLDAMSARPGRQGHDPAGAAWRIDTLANAER